MKFLKILAFLTLLALPNIAKATDTFAKALYLDVRTDSETIEHAAGIRAYTSSKVGGAVDGSICLSAVSQSVMHNGLCVDKDGNVTVEGTFTAGGTSVPDPIIPVDGTQNVAGNLAVRTGDYVCFDGSSCTGYIKFSQANGWLYTPAAIYADGALITSVNGYVYGNLYAGDSVASDIVVVSATETHHGPAIFKNQICLDIDCHEYLYRPTDGSIWVYANTDLAMTIAGKVVTVPDTNYFYANGTTGIGNSVAADTLSVSATETHHGQAVFKDKVCFNEGCSHYLTEAAGFVALSAQFWANGGIYDNSYLTVIGNTTLGDSVAGDALTVSATETHHGPATFKGNVCFDTDCHERIYSSANNYLDFFAANSSAMFLAGTSVYIPTSLISSGTTTIGDSSSDTDLVNAVLTISNTTSHLNDVSLDEHKKICFNTGCTQFIYTNNDHALSLMDAFAVNASSINYAVNTFSYADWYGYYGNFHFNLGGSGQTYVYGNLFTYDNVTLGDSVSDSVVHVSATATHHGPATFHQGITIGSGLGATACIDFDTTGTDAANGICWSGSSWRLELDSDLDLNSLDIVGIGTVYADAIGPDASNLEFFSSSGGNILITPDTTGDVLFLSDSNSMFCVGDQSCSTSNSAPFIVEVVSDFQNDVYVASITGTGTHLVCADAAGKLTVAGCDADSLAMPDPYTPADGMWNVIGGIVVADATKICFDGGTCTTYILSDAGDMTIGATSSVAIGSSLLLAQASAYVYDDFNVFFGTGQDSAFQWDTAQTNDALLLSIGGSRTMIISDATYYGDMGLANQTNPTVVIRSGGNSAVQYMTLAHNQTDAVIDVSTGYLKVPAGIKLQNDETITNAVDGYVSISAGLSVAAGSYVCLDGTTCHEQIYRPADNLVRIYSGSAITADMTSGNTHLYGTLQIGGTLTLQNYETIGNGTDGTISFATNDGTAESIGLDLASTSNTAAWTTTTGVTVFSIGSMQLVAGSAEVNGTLTLQNDETITNATDGTIAIGGLLDVGNNALAAPSITFNSNSTYDGAMTWTGSAGTWGFGDYSFTDIGDIKADSITGEAGALGINSVSNGAITITPNGSGDVNIIADSDSVLCVSSDGSCGSIGHSGVVDIEVVTEFEADVYHDAALYVGSYSVVCSGACNTLSAIDAAGEFGVEGDVEFDGEIYAAGMIATCTGWTRPASCAVGHFIVCVNGTEYELCYCVADSTWKCSALT